MGNNPQYFEIGDKIGQIIIEKCAMDSPKHFKTKLDETTIADQGFGSTNRICKVQDRHMHREEIQNIVLSNNPYGLTLEVEFKICGNDLLLGMELDNTTQEDRLILLHCRTGTPAAKITRWRSQLRGSHLVSVDGKSMRTICNIQRMH